MCYRDADAWVEKHFAGSKVHYLWTMLPSGILVSLLIPNPPACVCPLLPTFLTWPSLELR